MCGVVFADMDRVGEYTVFASEDSVGALIWRVGSPLAGGPFVFHTTSNQAGSAREGRPYMDAVRAVKAAHGGELGRQAFFSSIHEMFAPGRINQGLDHARPCPRVEVVLLLGR